SADDTNASSADYNFIKVMKKIKITIISILLIFAVKIAKAETPTVKVIPRAAWGADEVLRYKNSEPVWEEEYSGIKKIIIHHTAGSDGTKNPQDTVQAVYKWHARNLNWGDVGYNYLIDPYGKIYEGRYGGDGVIGAHAYDDSRAVGWNRGTIGISLLGTYGGWINESKHGEYLEKPKIYPTSRVKNERLKDGQWQIYLEDSLSIQAEDSLSSLIAVKSLNFGFEPTGVSEFQGKSIPNVVGHRDVDATTCPGDGLYNRLSPIRQRSQKKYDEMIAKGIKQKATLVGDSDVKISLKKDEVKEVVLKFRNDGDLTWHNYTDDKVILADAGVKSKLAVLDGIRLALSTNEHEFENELTRKGDEVDYMLQEPNVKPGEVGTFKITVAYNKDKLVDEKNLILAMQEKGWFSGTDIVLTAAATDLNYKGEMESQNLPPAIFENSKGESIIKFKNTGTKIWYSEENDDIQKGSLVYLKIIDRASNGKSNIYDPSWKSELGMIKPEESEVKSGDSATFKFKFKVKTPEFYRTEFILMRESAELENQEEAEVAGCVFDVLTRVDSPIQAELIEAEVPTAMLNIWTSKAKFKIKNTGIVPWDTNFALKVIEPDGSESQFEDVSWGKNGVASHPPTKIMPGQMAIMTAKLKAPKSPGVYHPTFRWEFNGKTVYMSHHEQLIYSLRVDES
ncbi:N-acetylmuramoyl-L-alanine amidase, partial [Patescibacteria group bacterium]